MEIELNAYLDRRVYTKEGHEYKSITLSDTTKLYLHSMNKKGIDKKCFVIDDDLNITKKINLIDVYAQTIENENHIFFTNDTLTYILDKYGKEIAKITAPYRSRIVGTNLYYADSTAFYKIDLSDFLGKKK